jgi:hypothetical protein
MTHRAAVGVLFPRLAAAVRVHPRRHGDIRKVIHVDE